MMRKIVVVGSMNMDIVNRVERHPMPGETISGKGVSYYTGGKGANQAVAAAQSQVHVSMVGAIGKDAFGAELKSALALKDVHTDWIKEMEGTSGIAFITVDDLAENIIILAEGANGAFSPEELTLMPVVFDKDTTVLLQNEIPWETNLLAMNLARQAGSRVIFNPAPALKIPTDILPLIDLLILNEKEAEAISGVQISNQADAQTAVEKLLDAGGNSVIITLGDKGSLYADRVEGMFFSPAYKVKPVDTTAAGDTFIGAYAAASGTGMTVSQSLQYASAAAAIVVTREGAQSSIPTKAEILTFIDNN
ncbi:ribokinase [Paenibacillus eucommiae]|uniref:Ribokinase n=1 Tax=Paenibacillus eucommiae TaxID=1355755 RepID=A0ABS4J7Y6_9BACL|nr:ribokinase [Paenibacillus eucommiae]MBP1995186.1 ribokinase [Paenibacillus eucommiae]